jgi:osmotically-inducible protein OsmY
VIVLELDVKLTGSTPVTDEDIERVASLVLSWNSLVPADRIKVRVGSGGRVTLEGAVDWHYQKMAAHVAVGNLRGVTSVADNVTVKPPRPPSIHDAVQAHVEAALTRMFGKHPSHIRVETRRDHVTLWGTVDSLAERSEAERAAWTTPGVCHVENQLSVADRAAAGRTGS